MRSPAPDRPSRTHVHQLVTSAQAHVAVHGSGAVGSVNKWLAVTITRGVGTMWCAYAFGALALVSLPAAIASRSPVILVSWLSQTFLQLVLLSIIIVGQQVLAEGQDLRAAADHESIGLDHQILESLLDLQHQQMQQHTETLVALGQRDAQARPR